MAHDITKDVIGCREIEIQKVNISGEPAEFFGSITEDDHMVTKKYVDDNDGSPIVSPTPTPFVGDEPNLVSLWHFNEGSGTVVADSVGSNDLTLASDTWVDGLFGSAGGAYASRTNLGLSTEPWTVMGWYYTTGATTNDGIFSVGNTETDSSAWIICYTGPTGDEFVQFNGSARYSNIKITPNEWHHFAFTFDGVSKNEIFLDGMFVATSTRAPGSRKDNMYFGSSYAGQLPGLRIDEWAFFDKRLSPATIANYSAGKVVIEDGLTLPFTNTALTIYEDDDGNASLKSPSSFSSSKVTFGQTSSDVLTVHGITDNSALGPLIIKSNRPATVGAGFSLDATDDTGGHVYSFISTGILAFAPVGSFSVFDGTANHYPFTVLGDGNFLMANNFYDDEDSKFTVIPSTTTDKAVLIRGKASQTGDLLEVQNNAESILMTVSAGGDLYFTTDGSGLPFAQIYEEDGTSTLALSAQDTYYQITAFTVNGESNLATPDHTNDHITIVKTGKYLVSCSAAISSANKNEYDFHIKKNNGATDFPCTSMHRTTSVANAVGQLAATGIIDLTANDTVELWVKRLDGAAVSKTITIINASITLSQLGG